jgi:hypothetical protein
MRIRPRPPVAGVRSRGSVERGRRSEPDAFGDDHVTVVESGGVKRTQALFVKPGRGDGTFGPIRVWRLPVDTLGVKTSLADAFGLFPTRKVGRADVVFAETGPAAVIDVVVAK